MWAVCKKEFRQFFSNLTGYIAIIAFLLLSGLFLFVFPDTNFFDYGFASMESFFAMAPWILLLLVPAITMRSLSEEFRAGTYEILQTKPLSKAKLVLGKYFGALMIVVIALIPTLIYPYTINQLAAEGGIDSGAVIGAYIGLFFLSAVFTAIGICCSSLTQNAVASFIIGALLCFLLYSGFNAISRIPALEAGMDYYIEMMGIDYHYQMVSKGVLDSRNLLYFLSIILFFLLVTRGNLLKR